MQMTVTNIEKSPDIIHGVAIPEHDINLALAPQDTREVTFTADDPGVYWIYCTYFCSALHLEMRSRMIVEPRRDIAQLISEVFSQQRPTIDDFR